VKKAVYYLLTLWIFLWGQVVSNHVLGGTLFSVQWILLAILHTGLARGPWTGELIGFIWGLLMDSSSLGLLGLHAMLGTLAGYAAGMFRRQLDSSKVWTQAIFSWMVSVVYFGLYGIVTKFFSLNEGPFQWALLTVPIANALAAPIVFRLLEIWTEAWGITPMEH
jgi:rod shape-determining protein MreD